MLRKIAGMIEPAGLQIGPGDPDFGKRGLRQNLGRDIVDRRVGNFMNEADVLVFAGGNARDDLAPGDLGIDNGLAPAPSIVYHHNEILHGGVLVPPGSEFGDAANYFGKSEVSQAKNSVNQKK